MRPLYSIKLKLLLLLVTTLVLTLVLVGVSMNTLITAHYRNQASDGFKSTHQIITDELAKRGGKLEKHARSIAQRIDIVSVISLVNGYASPHDYQPLIFDGEKKNLAREILIQAHAADIDQLALYTAKGELVAFHTNAGVQRSGYLTYDNGHKRLIALAAGDNEQWKEIAEIESLAFHDVDDDQLDRLTYRYHDHRFEIEVMTPLIRYYPDGTSTRIGYVVATDFLSDSIIRDVEYRSGVKTAVYLSDGSLIGTLSKQLEIKFLEFIAAENRSSGERHELETEDYYVSIFPLNLTGGSHAYFISAMERATVTSAIRQTQKLVFPVLLLALLIIVPLGTWAAKRVISTPVEKLVNAVERMERGDFTARVSTASNDEIGMLACAFNGMVSAIERREESLIESETKYRTLVDNLPQRVFYKDRNSVYVSCNRQFASDMEIEPSDVVGKTDYDFSDASLADKYRADDNRIMESGIIEEIEETYLRRDGTTRYIHTVKTPLFDESGKCTGILGIFWDVTDKKLADERLRQSATVFESTGEGVIITDASLKIIAVNKAFSEITGYAEAEVLGNKPNFRRSSYHDAGFYKKMWSSIISTGRWQGEIWNRNKNGQPNPEWMTISTVYDEQGAVSNYVAVFSDISEVKESQQRLDHMAHHDPLTDLPNRLLLSDRLEHAISRARRMGELVAVMFLDLDRFKNVNDTLGHPLGDALLIKVAERLCEVLREGDTVARLGGDEFVILLEGVDDQSQIESIANKILDLIGTPFRVQGQELYIGTSIGISLFPGDGEDVSTLIRNADTAMYRAKEQGKHTFRFYTAELTSDAITRMATEASLRHAFERNELEVYYQPQYDFESGELVGAEALLRWHSSEHGVVSPDRFIPLAEDIGMIVHLGEWVLATACAEARYWLDQGHSLRTISVNLSGIQLERDDIVEKVSNILQVTQLPPHMLELEITESVLMKNPEQAVVMMDRLRSLGIGLAVDDFGTGYSSLSYLKRFPITTLKIDKSFVSDIPHDSNDTAITQAVIALGHSLQLKITAEGVETRQQAEFLRSLGCDRAQGYLFGRPVPVLEFREMAQRLKIG